MNLANWQHRLQRLPSRGRTILVACAYGLAGGGAAVAFLLGINAIYKLGLVRLSHQSLPVFLLGSLGLLTGSALVVGWLLNSFCKEAAGSGIPQLKLAFWKDFGWVPFRVAWVKFIAGMISVGCGSSLGREGPSVQIGGTLASTVAGLVGEPKQKHRPAAAAGAAAGAGAGAPAR